mmetsp:Transcript_1727/g.2484  ORF Transcript_1727/g.2484 Transcript_1727/m.2484 type:complete len:433 (-) Transcript_1727:872-2170(-)
MAPIPKRKTERAPPIDKLMKPAIGIGLALLAYQFMKGLTSEIPRVDMTDDLALRDIFFGEGDSGKSYAVLCHDDESGIPISSVFADAYDDGSSPAEFRIMNCENKLESGKTVVERFKLNLKKRPVIFVSGANGPPKQVPQKHLKTGAMLVKLLRNMLEPRAAKIETTQDLRSKCLDKEVCGLLMKGDKQVQKYVKDAMTNLLAQHPNAAFASVDTSLLFLKNVEEHLPEFEAGEHRFAVFKKISGGIEKDNDRLKTSVAPLNKSVSFNTMNNLVTSVLSKNADMIKLSTLPQLKTRTKKLVQEEKAKRQRRTEQQSRQEQKSQQSSSSSGAFSGENDGSKEGRRAERERRREQHRKDNDFKEKTPEEKAEMERQRRLRMEEESAKWNIAPEDAPPEGDPVDDGEAFEEAGYEDVVEDMDEDDDDDEDVMDLD